MNGSGGFGFNSSSTATPNFDNLLLQSLMSRLQLRSPTPHPAPPSSAAKSLEDLLFSDLLLNLSESESDSEIDDSSSSKTQLAKEESKLEKDIVRTILSGEIDKLKPNSGQAIAIGEHHICVGFQEEVGSDYRVWEWHGHIMLFDEENGYTPEYIYGNYFERLGAPKRKLNKAVKMGSSGDDDDEKDKVGNVGLKELIEGGNSGSGRVLHRNLNANSKPPRF
ncbi:hypothetical protein AAHA92_17594 [Salvia divinorum]